MKKALVLSLFVVLAATVAGTAQIQGEWDSWLKLDLCEGSQTPSLTLGGFYSYIDVQYLICGWTLEAAATISACGVDNVWFEAYGQLGAFSAWSLAYFNPTKVAFGGFENGAEVSIAGVDIYALFAIAEAYGADCPYTDLGLGTGFALGGIGSAGDCRFGAEITWNLYPNLWFVFLYGLNGAVTDWTYTYCTSDVWYPYWYVGGVVIPVQSGCDVVFSYITAIAEFPICCADVYAMVEFSCTGFDYLNVLVKNIDIGLDWLSIYELGITFTTGTKVLDYYFQVKTGDVVCFTPYISVDMNGAMLDGITLNALTLSCDIGGCQFFWGDIFDRSWTRLTGWMRPATALSPYTANWFFEAVGGTFTRNTSCAFYVKNGGTKWTDVDADGIQDANEVDKATSYYPNEVIGFQCDEDSCCGGLFSFSINNFFTTLAAGDEDFTGSPSYLDFGCYEGDDPDYLTHYELGTGVIGLFGWVGSYFELTAGIGSNVSLIGGLKVTFLNGVEFITFGVNVAF